MANTGRSQSRKPKVEPEQTTSDRIPPRRRGGQELPDEVQDRPEQNAGYDEAVQRPGGSTIKQRHTPDIE